MHDSTDKGRRSWMGRAVLATGVGLASGLLGACAGLLGPRSIFLSEARLMEMLGRRFPFQNRYLQAFDITLSSPRLRLLPQSNRLATEMQLTVGERLLKRSWQGVLGVNYGLRYEPSDTSVRLTDLRLERLDVDGAPDLLESQLARFAVPLIEQFLHDFPIHRFKPEDLRLSAGLRYVPAALQVTHSGVSITLEPERKS